MEDNIQAVEIEYKNGSKFAADQAHSHHIGQLDTFPNRYGYSLVRRSYGEAFLSLFESRLVQGEG